MADNTVINTGAGGDTVRDVQKGGTSGPKSQVFILDRGGSGTEDVAALGDAANGIDVDVTRVIPGVTATALGKAEDGAHTSGDVGVFNLAVLRSEANALTPTAGTADDYTAVQTDSRGALVVVNRPNALRISTTSAGLTIATTAYAIGDQVGTIFTIAGASKISGGTGTIQSIVLLDEGDVGVDYRLHFYQASVTVATDNAAFAISDTDQRNLVGIITMPSMLDVGANRVSTLANVGLGYTCSGGTSLYCAIETRTANAIYTAVGDLKLILHTLQD